VKLQTYIGGLLVALAAPFQAYAVNTEYSDLWWNPTESGWGVGLERQDDVIFLTLFVYDADGKSTWFVGPEVRLSTADMPNSSWSGKLYRSTGPAFSAPYDGNIQATEVGTASLQFANAESGTFRYTVNGVQVTKQISRQTIRRPSAAGTYYGGFSTQIQQCVDPLRVGVYDFEGAMTVTQADDGRVVMSWASGEFGVGNSNCTFTAPTTRQSGRLGFWSGTFSCTIFIGCDFRCEASQSTRRQGTFHMDDIAANADGFHGVFTGKDQDCDFTGFMGGVRK
jgi:hypothetical protein